MLDREEITRIALSLCSSYFVSVFLWRWSLRYHNSRLFLGRKSDTARARSCQPWTRTYWAGLVLQSRRFAEEWACTKFEGLCELDTVEVASPLSPAPDAPGPCESHVNSDCVAHNRSCCNFMVCWRTTSALLLAIFFTLPIHFSFFFVYFVLFFSLPFFF